MKEYACTVVDVLARQTSLAFLNVQTAEYVVEIMAEELGWGKKERTVSLQRKHSMKNTIFLPPPHTHFLFQAQLEMGKQFLQTMGLRAGTEVRNVEIKLSYQEAIKCLRV